MRTKENNRSAKRSNRQKPSGEGRSPASDRDGGSVAGGQGPTASQVVLGGGAFDPRVPVISRADDGTGKVTVSPNGLLLIEAMARDGYSMVSIAKALRIDQVTLRQIRRRDPAVQEALDLGLAANERELVNLLMTQARDGQVVPAIFLLKAKHGFREGEQREPPMPNITINLPGAMNPEDYMNAITIRPNKEGDQ